MNRKNYSVAVVATMSAGKSTLLNSMIGAEILPSQNEACTAKVYSITDDDNATGFTARTISSNVSGEWQPATRAVLSTFNKSNADKIEICGDLRQIKNMRSGRAVLLYDTPGPNNSQDATHSQITEKIIKESDFCSIICVLNATQLNTDDEFNLLHFISQETKKKNTNSNVLFVLNKVDEFKLSAGESIRAALERCKKHLRDKVGFSNINLVPVSSYLALLIRMMLDTMQPMTREEAEGFFHGKKNKNNKYFRAVLPNDEDFAKEDFLRSKMKFFLRRKRSYASALKFSPEMKRGFLTLKEKQEKKKASNTYILVGERFYSLEDVNAVLLLTGVPLVELYLEKKMKKVSK